MGSSLGSTVFTQQNSRRLWLGLSALVLGVLAIGWISHALVRREVRHLVGTNLVGMRQTLTTVVQTWIDAQLGIVSRVATRELLQADIEAAVGGNNQAAHKLVVESLTTMAKTANLAWWAVVDGDGVVRIAPEQIQEGRRLPAEAPLAEVLAGTPHFSPAVRLDQIGLAKPLFLACAKLPIDGLNVALVFAHDPAGTFSTILAKSGSGGSIEAYAFDGHGRMLSQSRFFDELKASGRIPADAETTIFTVELRDPTVDGANADNQRFWPLTRIVAAAISGKDGVELEGYRDYHGDLAVASWGWLPEHGLGIAVKLDHAEAYRALHRLTWMTGFLLALVLLGGLGAVIHFHRAAALARRARQAEKTVQELGQYLLERKLGEGGMGAVYAATHRLMRRRTAVKLISGNVDAEAQARFEREVRLCCQLSHPNTIAIYDYGRTADNVFYYAMEHLDGMDLETLVRKFGPIPPGRAIHILVQACGSLAEAHRAKLLHRDIKPANIFLTQRGGIHDFVKVLDFGLVKNLSKTGTTLSRADIISGTPTYMAPETIRQAPDLDGRVDLYALALVGIFLLTGHCPFHRPAAMECVMAHLNEPLTSLARYGKIPADLERVLLACVAQDPAARPADAEVMAALLMECADAGTWTQRQARTWWEANHTAKNEGAADIKVQVIQTTSLASVPLA
jgi:tRNA A-37 threonylcarbamoyl transferase component Bud32